MENSKTRTMLKNSSILLVEDDEIDLMHIKRILSKSGITNPLIVANNGAQAMEVLRGTKDTPPLKKPYLVFSDLNMPIMDGFQFISEVRKDPEIKDTVIFVLSTSESEIDIERTYSKNIAGYLSKKHLATHSDTLTNIIKEYTNNIYLPVS